MLLFKLEKNNPTDSVERSTDKDPSMDFRHILYCEIAATLRVGHSDYGIPRGRTTLSIRKEYGGEERGISGRRAERRS